MRRMLVVLALMVSACSQNARLSDDPNKNGKTSEDWKGQTVSQPEELMAGRFPGVEVYRVQGGVQVRIRGAASLNGTDQPLYVVDGMPIDPGPGGALMGINPSDIDRIEVLKDIGRTSEYGVRGANGVVLITMKRAK